MDWPAVIPQALPAAAAILSALVTGLVANWNKQGERKHEIALRKADDEKETARLERERYIQRIEIQRDSVQVFLGAVRDIQADSAQVQGVIRERRNRAQKEGDTWGLTYLDEADREGAVSRKRMIQVWEVMDATLVDGRMRRVSASIGNALMDFSKYSGLDLGLRTQDPVLDPSPSFESLLSDLREASAALLDISSLEGGPTAGSRD